MSLKGFHLVFITLSTLLFVFMTLWGFLLAGEEDAMSSSIGISGIVGLFLLPVYGVYFMKKTKRIEL